MRLALINLDDGLFMDETSWTPQIKLAKTFRNAQAVAVAALERNIKNAAAAMLDDDFVKLGFIWVTNPEGETGNCRRTG